MDEVVVHLRENRRRYVGRPLAAHGEVHAKLAPLLDDFLERLKSVVAPVLALALRRVRQDVVCFVDDQVSTASTLVLPALLLELIERLRHDERNDLLLLKVNVEKRDDGDIGFETADARLVEL